MSDNKQHLHAAAPEAPAAAANNALLPGIHGLRFSAAFMVIIFHMSILGTAPPSYLASPSRHWGNGVFLFFMISAFSLMYSTMKYAHRPDWMRRYVIKRFFRIAPLFYVMLAGWVTYIHAVHGNWPTFAEIVLNLTFLFHLYPNHQSSLVWAGWTIGIEMIFYVVLPLIIGTITNVRTALVFMGISAVISASSFLMTYGATNLPTLFWAMVFPGHLQFFAAGVGAYFVLQRWGSKAGDTRFLVFFATALFISALILLWVGGVYANAPAAAAYHAKFMVLFFALTIWQVISPISLMNNKFMSYWGERSYSMYLLHGPIILSASDVYFWIISKFGAHAGYFISAFVTVSAVLLCSAITYSLIELPGMKIGTWLCGRWSNPTQKCEDPAPSVTTTNRR